MSEIVARGMGWQPAASDGSAVLDNVVGWMGRHLAVPAHVLDVLALWAAHTHAIERFNSTPYLHVTSAEPESGKSRILEVLNLLCARAELISNITPAALFRLIEKECPTLLLDEVDNLLHAGTDLIGILNSGYRRGTRVHRVGGSNNTQLETFRVFCPKAFAGLHRLPVAALASRCLRIEVVRRRQEEAGGDFIYEDEQQIAAPLAERLRRWTESVADRLNDKPDSIPGVRDRKWEAVRPLAAIAQAAGGDWPARLQRAVVAIINDEPVEEASDGLKLLTDIREIFLHADEQRIRTSDIVRRLAAMEESPWGDLDGRPIDGRRLARLLRPYKIRPATVWAPTSSGPRPNAKGYKREQFEDAWERFLPAVPTTPEREERENPHHQDAPADSRIGEDAATLTQVLRETSPDPKPLLTNLTDPPVLTDEEIVARSLTDGVDLNLAPPDLRERLIVQLREEYAR